MLCVFLRSDVGTGTRQQRNGGTMYSTHTHTHTHAHTHTHTHTPNIVEPLSLLRERKWRPALGLAERCGCLAFNGGVLEAATARAFRIIILLTLGDRELFI